MKAQDSPIVVSETYNASVEDLWSAITEPEFMREWYFEDIKDFKPELGFKTNFVIEHNNKTFTHQWEIVDIDAFRKITYKWSYKEYQGLGLVTFELVDLGESSQLKLTNSVLNDFPSDMEEFTSKSCEAGWNYFIKDSLKNYLS